MGQELPDLNIYISFHEDDIRLVKTCVKVLERTIKGGLTGRYNAKFFKTNDVVVGERIGETLDERVESADLVIVLFSYNYRNNKIESQRVYARHEHPIIVMLEDVNKSVAVDPFAASDVVEGDSFSKVKGKEKTEQKFANRVLNVIERELNHMNDPSPKLSSEVLASGVLVAPLLERSEFKILPKTQILSGHVDDVTAVAWSPDGSRIVIASADGVRVLDAVTGVELLSLKRIRQVDSVAWSPDGRRIATGSKYGVRVLDAVTGKELLSLKCIYGAWSVAWSPDGSRIVTDSIFGDVRVLDAVTGKELLSLEHDHLVKSVAWSPDGRRIAAGYAVGDVRVLDAVTGKELLSLKCIYGALSVAWSPDGSRIAAASDGRARVWDAVTGKELLTLECDYMVESVAWSPDGRRIAAASDGGVRVWDAVTGEGLFSLEHGSQVSSVVWSPDGRRILTKTQRNEIRIWDVTSGEQASFFITPLPEGEYVVLSAD